MPRRTVDLPSAPLLATLLAALAVFVAIVMPTVVLVASTAIVGTGLAAKLSARSSDRRRGG